MADPTSPIRAVIVGCGVISRTHAAVMAERADIELVAIVDRVSDAATALADHYESELGGPRPRIFSDLADALADVDVDLVAVCTPSGLHAQLATQALAAGKHTIIEKPLDVDLVRARQVLEASLVATGAVTSVISQNRFHPSSRAVEYAIKAGRFGRITSAVATVANWRSQSYYDSGEWRGTIKMDGGGALMNQGVHTVDLLLSFLGRPVKVSAEAEVLAHERIEVEDTAVATIRFESGAIAVLHATTAAYPGRRLRVHVHGSEGTAIITGEDLEYFHTADADPDADTMPSYGVGDARNQASGELAKLPAADLDEGAHKKQYADILGAIRTGTRPTVGIEESTLALATVRAVYISAALGRPVDFQDVFDGVYDDVALRFDVAATPV